MSCTARIVEVTRAVAQALSHLADPALGLTVERAYAPEWLSEDYWRDNPDLAARFTGRRVYVFGSAERHEGPATRSEDENHYEVTVVVLERYTAPAADVPAEWMDERVAWVEREVFDRLGDARETENPVVADADPVSQEWVQVYSPDLLLQLRLFRSEVKVVYRKIEDTRRGS